MRIHGTLMAKVLVSFRVMPKEASTDLNLLETKIKNSVNPDKISREPIAFGLVAINISKLVEDAEGELDGVEKKLRSIESVGEVDVTEITRTI